MFCKSFVGLMGTVVACFLVCAVTAAAGGITIHVDTANTEGPWYGSEAHPWQTIGDGADHLAEVNAAAPGGHTVLVAAGTYGEHPVLTSAHAGDTAATNLFLADGNVRLDNLTISGSQHLMINGFRFNISSSSPLVLINNDARGARPKT